MTFLKKLKTLIIIFIILLTHYDILYADDKFDPELLRKMSYKTMCRMDRGSADYDKCDFNFTLKHYEYFKKLTKSSMHYDKHKLEKYAVMGLLASMYSNGLGVEKDYKKALSLDEEVFNFSVDESEYFKEKDYLNIYSSTRNASRLGYSYKSWPGVRDYQKAFEYLTFAADNGEPYAINNLGYMYEEGRGIKKDLKKAFKLYKRASLMGNHWSHSNLAKYYLFGYGGINKSYTRSINHIKLSLIEAYSVDNFANLEILFEKGRLPKDVNEFYSWLKENLKKNKISISDIVNIAHFANTRLSNYIDAYKWFYICYKFPDELDIKTGSESEKVKCEWRLDILESEYLSNTDIEKAKIAADEWTSKYMN